MNMVLAALRSSEFWVFLAGTLMEAFKSPVPDDFKIFGGLYIGFRVASKVAKFVFPNGVKGKWFGNDQVVAAALLGALLLATPAIAQEPVPITSISARAHVLVNAGGMFMTQGDDWSGASLGGIVGYNLHQQLSVFGAYDRGIPVNSVDEGLDLWRAVASLRVHPNAFAGFGYAWFDEDTEGGYAHLLVSKKVMPKVWAGGLYAHVFTKGEADDFEYARLYVSYELFGGR